MVIQARVQNGMLVPMEAIPFSEGTVVRIEVEAAQPCLTQPRQGGQLRGQIEIAADFDELPPDLREAFGMSQQ